MFFHSQQSEPLRAKLPISLLDIAVNVRYNQLCGIFNHFLKICDGGRFIMPIQTLQWALPIACCIYAHEYQKCVWNRDYEIQNFGHIISSEVIIRHIYWKLEDNTKIGHTRNENMNWIQHTIQWQTYVKIWINIQVQLRWITISCSPRKSRFDPKAAHVVFVVDKMALTLVFSIYFGFLLPLTLHQCSMPVHPFTVNII